MKTAVALFCALYFVCCGVTANEVSETCLKQMGLNIFELGNLIRDTSPEGIRTRGCFESCLMQKIGLMNGNVINLNKMDEQIDRAYSNSEKKDIIRDTIHQCAYDAANDDECVVAQKFGRCGLDQLRFAELAHHLS